MTPILAATSLCLVRGDRCLFKDLEFSLRSGELLVVDGPNGSGKTSLLRGVAGLLDFETGAVHWGGVPVLEDYQVFRADLAWFAHRVGFKGELTLTENLDFESSLGSFEVSRRETVLERLGLTRIRNLAFRSLSAGQQRRVALARMMLSRARLWIMDEPFTNLDREGQLLVHELISGHLETGGLCMVATHQPLDIFGNTQRLAL